MENLELQSKKCSNMYRNQIIQRNAVFVLMTLRPFEEMVVSRVFFHFDFSFYSSNQDLLTVLLSYDLCSRLQKWPQNETFEEVF